MTKTYITCAAHWNCPGVRHVSCASREAADREAAKFTNELVAEWEGGEHHRDAGAPPLVQGSDWEPTLRALQLKRLIDYLGGEGEANDALDAAVSRSSDLPPLVGNGFTPELQEAIERLVDEDQREEPDARIGFPMVWIEEVDRAEDIAQPPSDSALLAAIHSQRAAWAARQTTGEMNETACEEEADTVVHVLDDVLRVAGLDPAAVPPLDLRDLLAVIGWAEQFAQDWLETAEEQDREQAALALTMVARVRAAASRPADQPIRVVVSLEGGCVQGAVADQPLDLTVVDYDVEGALAGDITRIPQDDGFGPAEACVGGVCVLVDSAWVQGVLDANAEQHPSVAS